MDAPEFALEVEECPSCRCADWTRVLVECERALVHRRQVRSDWLQLLVAKTQHKSLDSLLYSLHGAQDRDPRTQ